MKFCFRIFVLSAALLLLPGLSWAQEALEIHAGDTPEPSPIPEKTSKPEPPAESDAEQPEEEKPKKRKKEKQQEQSASSLQDGMTADEFKKAGLDKLSSSELKALNDWMKGYRQQAETKAAEKATAETKAEVKQQSNRSWLSQDRIFSRINGDFRGINGKTVIALEDGTVWKQANETDHMEARMTDHPPVMIVKSLVGYKMHVIGTGEFYVNPVRQKK